MLFEARSIKDHRPRSDQGEGLIGMGWMVFGMWSEENSASKIAVKFKKKKQNPYFKCSLIRTIQKCL